MADVLKVEWNSCDCHPETCCCADYRIVQGEQVLMTGSKDQCEAIYTTVAAALARAEADAARLDWLEKVGFTTRNRESGERLANVHSWLNDAGGWTWTAAYIGSEFPTARAAIDAIAQATGPQPHQQGEGNG